MMPKNKDAAETKKVKIPQAGEVIAHPLAVKPTPFMEEINIVRLEGRSQILLEIALHQTVFVVT